LTSESLTERKDVFAIDVFGIVTSLKNKIIIDVDYLIAIAVGDIKK